MSITIKSWRVRIIDTDTGAIVAQAIVDAPNKMFARWNSGMHLVVGQRFTVSPVRK